MRFDFTPASKKFRTALNKTKERHFGTKEKAAFWRYCLRASLLLLTIGNFKALAKTDERNLVRSALS